jgi:integrase
MASAWIERRATKDGAARYVVKYKLGGRGVPKLYGGIFKTKTEAKARCDVIRGDLAVLRVPDLTLHVERLAKTSPTFAEAADAWRATRVDVTDGTRTSHDVALKRAMPTLGPIRVDAITVDDVIGVVTTLAAAGRKKETIRKTIKYTAAVLAENGIDPNPARSKRVRLPHEEREEITPPEASHVEDVIRLLPSVYQLPVVWLDWSGARLASVETLTVGDYDEPLRRVRLRRSTQKTGQALWVELHPVLAAAIEATLPPREDRDPAAPLFPSVTPDRLRTAIGRACRAAGIPLWSPHDLRHRRISLLHRQGRSWAEIGRLVGQRKLSVTADVYTHVLMDAAEVNYAELLDRGGAL